MWETLTTAWGSLLEPLGDPVTLAIPAFLVFLGLEWFAARKLEAADVRDGRAFPPTAGYESGDARATISMGLVSVATTAAWKFLALLGYAAIYAYLAPWHLPANAWYTWVIAARRRRPAVLHVPPHRAPGPADLGDAPGPPLQRVLQLRHRAAAEVEQQWRDPDVDSVAADGHSAVDGVRRLLGEPDLPVLGAHRADRQAAAAVRVRVQHPVAPPGAPRLDPEYLDKNYAGILIVWDRMFGTFQPETHRPHYGLTKPVDTYNIWKLQTHEYAAIARDVRAAASWRDRLGYMFGPPGWAPSGAVEPQPKTDRSVAPESTGP